MIEIIYYLAIGYGVISALLFFLWLQLISFSDVEDKITAFGKIVLYSFFWPILVLKLLYKIIIQWNEAAAFEKNRTKE